MSQRSRVDFGAFWGIRDGNAERAFMGQVKCAGISVGQASVPVNMTAGRDACATMQDCERCSIWQSGMSLDLRVANQEMRS
jgi:hypothetical protein